MESHRTRSCREHGHPEVTIQISGDGLIPNLAAPLIKYFEESVAGGTKFLPGQTVRWGWSRLRICKRLDGTLGVEVLELTREIAWTESATRALQDHWFQVQVLSSVGLTDQFSFPRQDDGARVQPCVRDGDEMLFHRLAAAHCPEGYSGWSVSCRAEHAHEEKQLLPLVAVAAVQPGLVQFLALPHDTAVFVRWRQKEGRLLIEPHILRGEKELKPDAGSYLDRLLHF